MPKPAVFFDRDNTLIANDGYLGDPAAVHLIPGAAAAIARARALGFVVVTFSNQSGVARGMFTEEAVEAVNLKMEELLRQENPQATIDRQEYCPFHPEATIERYRQDSDLRKPKAGMLRRAARALDLDLSASWVIGDAGRDIEAGHAAGCRTILLRAHDPSVSPSPAALEPCSVDPDETVATLAQALDIIQAATASDPPAMPAATIERSRVMAGARSSPDMKNLEHLAQQILDHLKRRHEHPMDFSLGKLLAGVTQVLAVAAAVGSYFYKPPAEPNELILLAIFLELLTIALLAMGRER